MIYEQLAMIDLLYKTGGFVPNGRKSQKLPLSGEILIKKGQIMNKFKGRDRVKIFETRKEAEILAAQVGGTVPPVIGQIAGEE